MRAERCLSRPTSLEIEKFKQETRRFWAAQVWENPYALTLTMKMFNGPERLDQISASQNVHYFLNRLHRSVLHHRSPRLKTFSVFELSQRPHFHLCVDCPRHIAETAFKERVYESWIATRWARREIAIEPCYAVEGWLSYMVKTQTKASYPDAIDWRNCH